MEPLDRWQLRLVRRNPEAGTTVTFAFEPLTPLPFLAGQWLHLGCEPVPSDRTMVRHMSIASAPGDQLLEFTMDLGSQSAYKQAMGNLKVGDLVAAFKLRGQFTLDSADSDPVIFIAGGLGITPIRSLLRHLDATGSSVSRQLVHIARDHHLFAQELSAFKIPQTRTDHQGWTRHRDRVTEGADQRTWFYVCGSERFLDGIVTDLTTAGIDPDRIKTEDFH